MDPETNDAPLQGPARSDQPSGRVRSSRSRTARILGASAAAVGLAVGASAVAGAATGSSTTQPSLHHFLGGNPPAAMGKVTSVGTNTFTLTTRDGTVVTVNVGGSTTYKERGVTSAAFANVTTGERVAVFGTDSSNTVTATSVLIGGPGEGGPGPFGGTPPAI